MTDADHPPIMAIDGGGTRCRVAYVYGSTVIARETGPANVSSNFDGAIGEIRAGIEEVATTAGLNASAIQSLPAFVGLAGVTGPKLADRVRAALPFQSTRVEDDRVSALRGALGAQDGVIAHCGTGSFFAGQNNGAISLSGGWGAILGDEASACWVGRLALQLTLECVDQRRQASPLSDHLLTRFKDSAGIVLFAASARPADFGALAPLVTEHAHEGDTLATDIMQRAARDITRSLRSLGWQSGQAVCLTGGIGPQYLNWLPDDLHAHVTDRVGEPLDGAIALAIEFAREIANERC